MPSKLRTSKEMTCRATKHTLRRKITWERYDFISVGAVCAQSLEQFYMTIKRIHGISLGAQRRALPAGGRDETTQF
jgi:hypothetical protein